MTPSLHPGTFTKLVSINEQTLCLETRESPNMISGAGRLDFFACHSIEKLVIDAQCSRRQRKRLIEGIEPHTASLALASVCRDRSARPIS